jgi:hypothetical protein
MEVGRVGDLRIRAGSIVRLPLVGSVAARLTQPGKNGLTRAGLLMEVARHPPGGDAQAQRCLCDSSPLGDLEF